MRRRIEYVVLLLIAVGVANLVLLGVVRTRESDTPPNPAEEIVLVSTTAPFEPTQLDTNNAERISARSTTTTTTSPPRTFPRPTFLPDSP